ncbi:MAG: sugar phosphate isomerase/epimerase, partial [Lachnospiraceae bacterium]|nr:sugar phosphate isomerase/epimerase [Lachnospiraceae bacterium]
ISDCERHNIPTVVMHITRLLFKPEITQIGLDRIKRLVDLAEKEQINLALENLDSIQHLDYVYDNIKSKYLGFCYDSGHEYLVHRDADCLTRYGDKLFAVHLDDNCGDDDTHLLPYDGNINWDVLMQKLKKCKDLRYLTLEVDFNRKHEKSLLYKGLSADEFLELAYKRILLLK